MTTPGKAGRNHPVVCYITEDRIWELQQQFFWPDGRGSLICVPKGFRYDRSSIPRLCFPLICKDDLGNTAPLIHDLLYQAKGCLVGVCGDVYVHPYREYTRKDADLLFLDIMTYRKVTYWQRWTAYWAVRSPVGWAKWRW